VYESRGIDEMTDLSKLKPEDYPIFDDLYDTLLIDYQTAKGDYSKSNLRILINYISKFTTGGRNSHLWNGPSTLDVKENFTVFNFQSLLANKNNTVANAQMLLILKWLDNEIIKNRDYNLKYHANRRIIVVIDEAHVFIDPKYPVALDFMYQLAKRIRKYNGMQIIITQNIKDFVGTEEIARKSTAIINASQYSFIFPLAPNDMHDLCKLYEKAGAINETEQDEIVTNGRGQAFVITTPTSRSSIKIVASDQLVKMFE
jgi:type IV secretory pathway VirB4 component